MPAQILVYAIAVLIVYRFGLVPLAVAIFTIDMLGNVPFTADFSAWYMSHVDSGAAERGGAGGMGVLSFVGRRTAVARRHG